MENPAKKQKQLCKTGEIVLYHDIYKVQILGGY